MNAAILCGNTFSFCSLVTFAVVTLVT